MFGPMNFGKNREEAEESPEMLKSGGVTRGTLWKVTI
jgi:hypothetical protein